MILKKLLNLQKLRFNVKKFAGKNPEVLDVCIYGSIIRGKTNMRDIDFAILLKNKINVSKKLELAHELKRALKKELNFEIDAKAVDIEDLKDSTFLARQGILAEGYSILHKKYVADIFGFRTHYIFMFNLKGLSESKKIMFRYALNGRRGAKGIMMLNKCEHIGSGAIKVPIEHSEEFKELLDGFKINYQILKASFY